LYESIQINAARDKAPAAERLSMIAFLVTDSVKITSALISADLPSAIVTKTGALPELPGLSPSN